MRSLGISILIIGILLPYALCSQPKNHEACGFPLNVQQAIEWVNQKTEDKGQAAHAILENFVQSETGKPDTCIAILHRRLGVLSSRSGAHLEAIRYYKKALSLRLQQPNALQDASIIKLYTNIGNRYSLLGGEYLLDSATVYLDSAYQQDLARHEKLKKPLVDFGRTSQILGRLHTDLGDYDKAKYYLEASLQYYSGELQDTKVFRQKQAGVYNDLSGLYSNFLQDPEQALIYSDSAIALADVSLEDEISIYLNRGMAFEIKATLGHGEQAEADFNHAIKIYRQISKQCYALGGMEYEIALLQNNFGVLLKHKGEYKSALDSLRKAEKYNRKNEIYEDLAKNLDNIADALVGLEKYSEALTTYQEALYFSFSDFRSPDVLALPDLDKHLAYDKIGALTTLVSKAKLLTIMYEEQKGEEKYLQASLATYLIIDSFIVKIRQGFLAEASRFSLSAIAKPIYEQAIHACLLAADTSTDQTYLEQAFYFAERSKALSLLENLRNQQAATITLPRQEKEHLVSLMLKNYQYERELAYEKIYGGSSTSLIEDYYRKIIKSQNDLEEMMKRLDKLYPSYRKLKEFTQQSTSLDNLRKKVLNKKNALIEYFLGDSISYAFIVSNNQIRIESLIKSSKLFPLIKNLHYGLRGYFEDNPDQKEKNFFQDRYIRNSRALYEALIAPLGWLPERLIIIPDECLLYLPFEVLLSEDVSPQAPFLDYSYLIKAKIISYNFSTALLEEILRKKNKRDAQKQLGVFAPVFPRDSLPDQGVAQIYQSSEYAKALAQKMNGDLYWLDQAKDDNLREKGWIYQILHLATHAKIEDADSNLVQIKLWKSTIFLNEIPSFSLNADLIVLNACETNVGKLHKGEGIASLNRNFISAGAKSVLATSWPAADFFTPEFMEPFYQKIRIGTAKDKAVRAAKLKTLHRDPFYWASYVIYGDISPVSLSLNKFLWLGFAIFLLVGCIIFRATRKRQET